MSRYRAGPAASYEHFDVQAAAQEGIPPFRSKLVRRALAFGIDRAAARPGSPFGETDADAAPCSKACLPSVQSPYYRPNWSMYRYRPASRERLLEQAGCRRGADGIYSCAGERLSLSVRSTAGRRPGAGAYSRARASAAQTERRRGGADLRSLAAFFDQILPSGDFDVASSRGSAPGRIRPGPTSVRMRRQSRTSAVIANGW